MKSNTYHRILKRLIGATLAGGIGFVLAGCETFTTSTPSDGWQRTSDGATVWYKPRFHGSQRYTWKGTKNPQGYAHGPGVLTSYNPEIPAWDMFSSGYYEQQLTMTGKMVDGRFEGEVYVDNNMPARGRWYSVDNYSNGVKVSGRQLSHQAYQSSSSSFSDAQLVGGILAVGGAAGGDANVSGAGAQMMRGDNAGALRTLRSNSERSAGTAASTGQQASGQSTKSGQQQTANRKLANKRNLIDQPPYGLSRFRGKTDDPISDYISAADKAFESYKKTGDEKYYTQHREYADIALQFHKQTSTKGTRIGR